MTFVVSLQCDKSPSTNEMPLPSGPVLRSGVLQSSFDALTFANLRISHLLIDYVDDVTILFVITFDGPSLRKYSLLSNQQLCLLEHLQLQATSSEANWRVNKAELISETVKTRFFSLFSFSNSSSISERNSAHDGSSGVEILRRPLRSLW